MLPLFAISLLGCPAPDLPVAVVDHLEPAFAYNGDDETVTIVGQHFYPQVAIDAWQGDPDVDPAFRAWLVGPKGGIELPRELVGVGILDDRHLTATVVAGLPAGEYDLQIEGPTGREGKLPDAFTVTSTQVDRLRIQSPNASVPVTEPARIDVSVVDLGDNPVPVRFEVAVLASWDGDTGEPPPPPLEFDFGTLQDPERTVDGDGVHGFIEGGTASLSVTSTAVGRWEISVVPWDSASVVSGDELLVTFEPGADLTVEIALPSPGPFVAGEPFTAIAEIVDAFGNPAGVQDWAWVSTECSGQGDFVFLDGPTEIVVAPERATGTTVCPAERVHAQVSPTISGESAPYEVVAGPVEHFYVVAVPANDPVINAGEGITVLADARDANENPVEWSGAVTLTDSLGGLIDVECVDHSLTVCGATVTRAGVGVTITATGDDGTIGTSNPIDVFAGEEPVAAVATAAGPAVAGQPVRVEVTVADEYGNVMDPAGLGVDGVAVDDDLGEAWCLLAGYAPGVVQFDCTLYRARSGAELTPSVPAFGVVGAPAVIDVVNGPLAVISFAGDTSVVAGQTLALALAGADAWGNPYLVQGDPVVELTDDSGTLSVASATLGPDGTGSALGSFTRAGPTVVRAWQGGVQIGASAAITVLPAATDALRVTPAEPWAWVDLPLDVLVEGIDVYGNRSDLGGSVTLSSVGTASPPVAVTLVGGVGTAAFTWTSPLFLDTLEAAGSGFTGEAEIAVAEDCGASGPTAVASFGGHPEAIACVDPLTGAATVTVDLGQSADGGAPLTGYALAELGGGLVTDSQPVIGLDVVGVGGHPLRALVVDDLGCGSEVDATGWTGPDDGTPVGPLSVVPAADTLEVFYSIAVEVLDVVDCSRDPVSFGEVEIRTTGGTLLGPTASGSGLRMTLDANGDGAATLSAAAGLISYGSIEVHATAPSGAASGVETVAVDGDNVRPVVVAQEPSGATSELVSEVRLTFSEPLLDNLATHFTVTGPAATTVTAASLVDREVTLTLSPPADGSLGAWQVQATSEVRDLAGNKLAGTWTGAAAAYVGTFGGAAGAALALTCTSFEPSGLVLRPDGDPGEGAEADELSIAVSAGSAPVWWVLEVRDEADGLVWHDRVTPVAAVDTVVWPARDFGGLVVPNGAWRVAVWPDDGLGNRGAGCEVMVVVDNPTGWPP